MAFFKGVFLICFGLFFCLPLSLKLILPQERSLTHVSSACFGLSIGFLTLIMAYLATFYKPWFNLQAILIFLLLIFLLFSIFWLWKGASFPSQKIEESGSLGPPFVDHILKGSIGIGCLFILWASVYYPFVTQDAITHYAMPAKNIFITGGMDGYHIPDLKGKLDTYPLLIPLAYVYSYFAFGEINEYAAKVVVGLFSIGLIGSTYLLGRHLYSKRIGLFSTFLLSFSPLFLKWSSSGFTDIAGAFFYTSSILYYWLTYRYQSMKYAILTGLMIGFSIWTKNSTLLIFISICLFFMIQTLFNRAGKMGAKEGSIPLRHLVVILVISLSIGGPWYLRNYLLYRHLVPVEWANKRFWMDYGVPVFIYFRSIGYHVSIVYVFGLVYSFYRLVRKDTKILFLLSFVLPYLTVWALKFSMETRYLLMILPLLAVLSIVGIGDCFQKTCEIVVLKKQLALILIGVLIIPNIVYVTAKNRDLFSNPFISDDERRLKSMRKFYPLVVYFRDLQSKGERGIRIISPDGRLLYFLGSRTVSSRYPMKMDELKNYDYFVWPRIFTKHSFAPKGDEVSANLSNEKYFINVFESEGNIVYKIVH